MEIKDLKPNTGKVDLVLHVVEVDKPRAFEKFGKKSKVCNATVKDESGEVKMTLWNEEIELIKPGDKIHLQNGWCAQYKDELQVSCGKFGKIEVLGAEKAVPTTVSETKLKKSRSPADKTVFTNDPKMLNPMANEGDGDDDDSDGDPEEEEFEE
ncbi:MAG TPA: hypothetical protein VJA23_04205 [Candidatus Nanoarchaeia archaeon]|nr:hypothetical protein [Candidatus Nanoarchaeia archaeon]